MCFDQCNRFEVASYNGEAHHCLQVAGPARILLPLRCEKQGYSKIPAKSVLSP